MSVLTYQDLEIVGFEGTLLVECEMVLPVGRVRGGNLFFKFEQSGANGFLPDGIDSEKISFYANDEIESLAEEGRLTILRHPFPAIPAPLIAYVNREFLLAAESQLPESIPHQSLSAHVWVICASAATVEQLLNYWAARIMDKSTLTLERLFQQEDSTLCAHAERFTDLALCAATDRNLRSRIYLRAGVALMFSDRPERLDNLYQLILRHEFPDWSWDVFQERLQRMAEILRVKAKYLTSEHSIDPSDATDLIAVNSIVAQIEDPTERYAECKSIAERYKDANVIPEEWVEGVARVITASSHVRLVHDVLRVLQGDTLFYYLGETLFVGSSNDRSEPEKAPLMRTEPYLRAAKEFLEQHLDPGDVASKAIEKYVREPMLA